MRKIKYVLIIIAIFFASNSFASIRAVQDKDASFAQDKCVINVSVSETYNTNYDTSTAYVELKSKEAGYSEIIPLYTAGDPYSTNYGGSADVTISTAIPKDSKKTYAFQSTFYMAKQDSAIEDKLNTSYASVDCESQAYAAEKSFQDSVLKQKTGTVTSGATQQVYSAAQRMGGGEVQIGKQRYSISGIGSALMGCAGVGNWVREKLGGFFKSTMNLDKVTVDDSSNNSKESCGDQLAYAASRIAIENISRSVINWSNSGNDGSSFFPQNYKSLYQGIKDRQVQSFISELQSGQNTNPFSSSIAKSIASKSRNEKLSFSERTKYTGPEPAFFKDFKNGGWDSWFKYILVPQNNPLGYSQLVSEELASRKNSSVQETKDELVNNNGFLSKKVCTDKGYVAWKDSAEKTSVENAARSGDEKAQKRLEQATCKNYKVATPGSIIADQVKQVVGTPMRQAEQVDEMNEALGSLFDAMVANLASRGLSGLSDTNFKNRVNFAFNTGSNTSSQNLPTGGTFWDEFGSNFDLRRDLPGILKTQKAYLRQIEINNKVLLTVLQSIDRMDYVLPGPKVDWFESQAGMSIIAARMKEIEMRYRRQAKTVRKMDELLENIGVYRVAVEKIYEPIQNLKTYPAVYDGIKTRALYEELLTINQREVVIMTDVINQLEKIQKDVDALYIRACDRFKKDNPGAICI